MSENYKPGFTQRLNSFLTKCRLPFKVTFIITGIASTVWFLIKVIPKPSRATYPCMQAAAPLMSGFIIWLIGLTGTAFAFRKAKNWFRKAKFLPGLAMAGTGVIFCLMLSLRAGKNSSASPLILTAEHEANNPMGEAQGIFPGRVVWAWNPAATNENCSNSWGVRTNPADDDGYFLPKNNDQSVIDSMVKSSVLNLTGESTINNAWDALFMYHNQKKGKGEVTYSPEQTIFIKINQGTGDWMSDPADLSISTDLDWRATYYGITETLPQLVLSVLKQLVDSCGIPQDKIYIGDPRAHIFKHTYDYLAAIYPNVKYFDKSYSTLGRTLSAGPGSAVLTYSDKGTVMSQAVTDNIYQEMENADYLINMACLKGHQRAGITLTAKNHFGSHTRASAAHLHAGLVSVAAADWEGNYDLMRTSYGMYRVQVDLMAYKYLGENTLLFMVDGLWGGPEATMKPVKWKTAPFDNDWSSSLFISQDQVAIESVCFDFLRTEFTEANHPGLAFPNYPAADDYLHQAADSANWPEGIIYDPENDGISFKSLGVHEHWNDPATKQYSRNLGLNQGIELFAPGLVNSLPQAEQHISNVVIHKNSKPVYLVTDLRNVFSDPDGDDLTFSVIPDNSDEVDAVLDGDTAVIIQSGNNFIGLSEITVTASDGTATISETVLVKVIDGTQMTAVRTNETMNFDGIAAETIWENSRWYYIDQVWIPYRAVLPAEDFSGRYKVAWSADSNLLYFFAETYDDVFVDGYVYNSDPSLGGNYPAYDILEIFIDENKSGGKHVFDDGADWGTNAENAFSYHYSISQPEDGGTTSSVVACDIAGISWASYTIANYADHLENFIVRRDGNTLSWEFSLKVYNDTYDDANPENSRVTLTTGKQIGLSLAYCDNDNPNEEPKTRDNFIGSDVGPDQQLSEWNEHWMNASVYGNLKLDDDQPNRKPEVTGTINDLTIFADDIQYPVNSSLSEIFQDPDGDVLLYSGSSDNEDITVEIKNDTVFVSMASDGLGDNALVTITASDGDYYVSTQFTVFIAVDNIPDLALEDYIEIWPNPAQSTVNIKITNNILGLVEIHITDMSGRLLFNQYRFKTNFTEDYLIDLKDMDTGIYMIQVNQGSLRCVKKIIHQ